MPTVYIIDEDVASSQLLKSNLESFDYFRKIEIFQNSEEARNAIADNKPSLVFVDFDISLFDGAGLYTDLLRMDITFVCMSSVKDAYISAVRLQAFDYLIKPLAQIFLTEIIKKYILYIDSRLKEIAASPYPFHEILNRQKSKVMVNTTEMIGLIPMEDIIKIEGLNNYSRIFTKDGNISMVSKTLKYFETQLTSYGFVRAHKSYLINIVYIEKLIIKGGSQILLTSGEIVDISREKKNEIKEWFRI